MPSARALRVISAGELLFVAGERFRDHDRGVVGRAGDHALDRVLDLDRAAGLQPELGRRLVGGRLRDLQLAVELDLAGFEPLEQQVERHDLGQRGRMAESRRHWSRAGSRRSWRRRQWRRRARRRREWLDCARSATTATTLNTPQRSPSPGFGPDPTAWQVPRPRSLRCFKRSTDTPVCRGLEIGRGKKGTFQKSFGLFDAVRLALGVPLIRLRGNRPDRGSTAKKSREPAIADIVKPGTRTIAILHCKISLDFFVQRNISPSRWHLRWRGGQL